MKAHTKLFFILLFFLCFQLIIFNCFYCENINFSHATKYQNNKENYLQEVSINFFDDGRIFKFDAQKTNENIIKTVEQQKAQKNVFYSIKKLESFGLTNREIVCYLMPELQIFIEKLKKSTNIDEKFGKVLVCKNKCALEFQEGKEGYFVDENLLFLDIINSIKNGEKEIKINLNKKSYRMSEKLSEKFKEKSSFSTSFVTSSPERKNNIKVALSKFDGIILDEGEVLSFNAVTGVRDESAGYKKAKIITNGTFTEGFGGGVCQVSTTLYNACLLAGLDVLEVHSHSLPVSYVEPSFDAMVNVGSSDLVIQNNTGGQIIITSSSENNICKFKIFGLKNKYKITRISEKTKIIPAEPEVIETNYKKYGDYDLLVGEEKRLSYAKDGFYSSGYLNFYDNKGNLIKTKKIRENRYNPTKGVIIKREK